MSFEDDSYTKSSSNILIRQRSLHFQLNGRSGTENQSDLVRSLRPFCRKTDDSLAVAHGKMDHLDISDGALETLSDAAVVQISNEIGMRVPRQGDLRPPPPIRSDDSFGRKIEKGLLISNSMWLIQWWSVGCQESRLADLDMDDCLGFGAGAGAGGGWHPTANGLWRLFS